MIQETIDEIKKVEEQAEKIIDDAKIKAQQMIDNAKLNAEKLQEEELQKAREQANRSVKKANLYRDINYQSTIDDSVIEVENLRKYVKDKEKDAISLIISQII